MSGKIFDFIAPLAGAGIGSIIPGVGTALGATIGGGVGKLFGGGDEKSSSSEQPSGPTGLTDVAAEAAKPFEPTRSEPLARPAGFQAFGSLSPDQETSAIATQGVYGGGVGKQEQDYYQNLINRQLVDEGGGLQDIGTLSPINRSYLSQLGYGQGNTRDLLEAMQKWKMQA